MKKSMINEVSIAGYVYSFATEGRNALKISQVKNESSAHFGMNFISGNIDIAVDEDGLNVPTVHFTYIPEYGTSKDGKKYNNKTYEALKRIIDNSDKTWLNAGKDGANKVNIQASVALNEWPREDDTWVSTKVIEGRTLSILSDFSDTTIERDKFKTDFLVTKVAHVEADPDRHIDQDYVTISGAAFTFKGALLPMQFTVKNPSGMDYFESLEASPSEPVFTCVWGQVNCNTSKRIQETESAFGEAEVRYFETKTREWLVTGTSKVPYEFGDKNFLTAEELKTAMQNREVYLAGIKKRQEDYKASRTSSTNTVPAMAVKADEFNF
jgi:hypothetical protein